MGPGQLLAQRLLQRARQHQYAVLAALAVAHHDGPVGKVEVFHPQAQALGQPHAGAIEHLGQQTVLALHQRQHGGHLLRRQHHRQPPPRLRPGDGVHPGQLHAQHLPVQEQQRRQRLPVGADRHPPLARQPGEKGLNLRPTHLGRVTQPVKPDEGAAPVHIGLFGAQAVMQGADALPQLIEQPRRFQRRQCLTAPWRPARRRMGFMHLVLSLGAPFRGGGCQRPRAQVKCVVRTLRQFA